MIMGCLESGGARSMQHVEDVDQKVAVLTLSVIDLMFERSNLFSVSSALRSLK